MSAMTIPQKEQMTKLSMFWNRENLVGNCTNVYTVGIGVYVYIDGAQFLPDNCTISRCVVKVMTNKLKTVNLGDCTTYAYAKLTILAMSPTNKLKV